MADQGAKDVKEAPKRIEEPMRESDKMGGKLIGFYATPGEYDYIGKGGAPGDAAGTINRAYANHGTLEPQQSGHIRPVNLMR